MKRIILGLLLCASQLVYSQNESELVKAFLEKYDEFKAQDDLVIKTILAVFSISDTSPVIEVYGDRQLKIRLREINKLQDVLDKITINSLSFENSCTLVNFSLKSL